MSILNEHCTRNCSTPYALQATSSAPPGPLSFDPYEPEWTREDEERVGDAANGHQIMYGDGPKFVCSPKELLSPTPCLVYSFGSRNDLSFERGIWRLSQHVCEIHVFDPSPKAWQSTVTHETRSQFNGSFWSIGLSGSTSKPFKFRNIVLPSSTLAGHMQRLGHVGRKINILKVDIERGEWKSFEDIFPACAKKELQIDQLIIELHVTKTKRIQTQKTKTIINITQQQINMFFQGARSCGLLLFHKERNHWGCRGWQCVEFSFIHYSAACRVFNVNSRCKIPC